MQGWQTALLADHPDVVVLDIVKRQAADFRAPQPVSQRHDNHAPIAGT